MTRVEEPRDACVPGGRPVRLRRWLVSAVFMICLSGATNAPQEGPMSMPMDLQVRFFARVLEYDRSQPTRTVDTLIVGVVYQEGVQASEEAKAAFMEAARDARLGPHPVTVVEVAYSGPERLRDALRDAAVDILYVTPLLAVDVRSLSAVTRDARVLTFTGVADYVTDGVAVGLALNRGRPQILLNLRGAKREGANFSSEFLKLASFVDGGA